ncbi:unnamed protein product, partial [Staurois parvus]
MERQVSGPQAERPGRRTPRWSDRSRALRRSGGRRSPRRSDRHRVTRHNRGLRVNWDDRWHWVRHWIVWLDSGHRVTRHQVIWLDSGHRVIWQGSGLRVNWYDRGHWVRQIGSSGWTAGTGSPGIRSFGLTAGTASSGKAVGSES